MKVEITKTDGLYPGKYLARHSSMRRILENVIAKWNNSYRGTYVDEQGNLNSFSDSPIYIAKYSFDGSFRVELGCDFDDDNDEEASYD